MVRAAARLLYYDELLSVAVGLNWVVEEKFGLTVDNLTLFELPIYPGDDRSAGCFPALVPSDDILLLRKLFECQYCDTVHDLCPNTTVGKFCERGRV